MSFTTFADLATSQVAATPLAGEALQNGTPVLLEWTAPDDGNLHAVAVFAALQVSSVAETGGAVGLGWVQPSGQAEPAAAQLFASGLGVGQQWNVQFRVVQPGSTVTVQQTAALTAGGPATFWAVMWAV